MADTDLNHVLATRMNAEPSILRGCSSTELMLVAGTATLFWVPVAAFMAFFVGAVAIGAAGGLIVATVYIGAGVFQKIKRGRPDGYYQHRVDRWLHQTGLRRSRFVTLQEGTPTLGRTWQR
jgi:conjugative transfer region protein (TIGR03750 family)